MKLINAKLYEEQIKRKMWETWYDEKYQYYYGSIRRNDFSLNGRDDEWMQRAFAVLNNHDELIGYVSYWFDLETKVAQYFEAINFSDNKLAFGRALRQVIDDCFIKFDMEVIEWRVFCENPAERSYDRICEKLGGHIVGCLHKRFKNMSGNISDEKIYEILREDYLERRKYDLN